ncbi:hypothetical protein C0V70_10570 [Bacteriovorax stolpii]|uniref:Folylpolyglutamate synthetase n=1 Tax=Bacteriovorax stolpii TaxID=960 RepID=A0A2K9NSP3_BACTC|nr:hypothetical protein [Bacteriovorax stolpii]AUN98540.1 hypothetical protein C0V70_10570 [Bacteriovorax stolpii]TDP50832.1 dihydrofolate synthase/folylpolyglutamate synthase [Bacteriovorax stolpii]
MTNQVITKEISEDFDPQKEKEIMDFLTQNFGFEVFTPGLERTRAVYAPFIDGFKKQGTKVVIIAGTNGKGQTAHTLGSLLAKEKKSFALWTSPHILSIRERFLYSKDGHSKEASYEELKNSIETAQERLHQELPGTKVSFYEFLFLVFLREALNRAPLDYLLLEVGLGGKLDAVNHFDADCACITSISRDHQSILGSRYEQILGEKIAVSRANKVLFTHFSLNYLNELTSQYVKSHQVDWRVIPKNEKSDNYFLENQRLAWEMFYYLEPKTDLTFETGISHLPLYKGRREIMTFSGKSLIFIGAHNIDGVRRMLESFEEDKSLIMPESLLISFSARPLNEVTVMLKSLIDFFKERAELSLTTFDHPKALPPEGLKEAAELVNKGMLNFVFDWKRELQTTKSQTILVCGSYYFIGEVQRFIRS